MRFTNKVLPTSAYFGPGGPKNNGRGGCCYFRKSLRVLVIKLSILLLHQCCHPLLTSKYTVAQQQ